MLRTFIGVDVKVDNRRQNRRIPQCRRCIAFGHTHNFWRTNTWVRELQNSTQFPAAWTVQITTGQITGTADVSLVQKRLPCLQCSLGFGLLPAPSFLISLSAQQPPLTSLLPLVPLKKVTLPLSELPSPKGSSKSRKHGPCIRLGPESPPSVANARILNWNVRCLRPHHLGARHSLQKTAKIFYDSLQAQCFVNPSPPELDN